MHSDEAPTRAAEWLRALGQRTAWMCGRPYFRGLVGALAEVVGVPCAFVVELQQQKGVARVLAYQCGDDSGEGDEFSVADTVSSAVVGDEAVLVVDGFRARFPRGLGALDRLISAESCVATAALNSAGTPIGHVAIVDRERRRWDDAHVGVLRALGERTAGEIARLRAHRQGELLARVSHDLRSPLNGIIGYAGLLRQDAALGARQRDAADKILACGHRLLDTVNLLEDAGGLDLSADVGPVAEHHGASTRATSAPRSVEAPPADFRQRALEHARRGDIVELSRCLDELERGAKHPRLVDELRELAGAFDLRAIRERLGEKPGPTR